MKMKITNQRFNSFMAVLLLSFCFAACQNEFDQDLGPRPTGSFDIEPLEGEPNTYVLASNVEDAFRHRWNIGEGWYEGGRTDTVYFEMAGDYAISMIAMTRNGHVVEGKTLTVENNAPGVGCAGEPEEVITGCSDSQTWVLAGAGSVWVGPVDGSATWWELPASDLEERSCLLNDEFTFQSDGTYIFENNGDFWVEEEGGAAHPADIGLTIGCHPADAWPAQYAEWGSGTYEYEIGDDQITVTGTGAFLGIYKLGDEVGAAPAPEESITYDIVELTADRMVLEKVYDWGKWRLTFMPEGADPGTGGEEPEEPEEPSRPYEARDIAVDFEGNSTIEEDQWLLDQVAGYEFPVENPAPDDVNPSENVFRYDRGTGQYENIQIHLDHKMDLTDRHIFRVKVYFPADNDYSGDLTQTFSVKLQNRELGGNAWQTQVEIIKTITDDQLGQWVELTYDFSGFAVSRTDNGDPLWDEVSEADNYDSIVIQPGGEGHTAPGTFYFDDFELLPAE